MMKLDLKKLKKETLMDIVTNVHEGAECVEETIQIVGGSSRKEYVIKDGPKPLGCSAFSEDNAWLYAAEVVIHLVFIVR